MLYHIVPEIFWKHFEGKPTYFPITFEKEGFIHLCTKDQVTGVLERYYQGQTGLLLLEVDETRITSDLRWEPGTVTGELFPHIYGGIDAEAVVNTNHIR